MIDDRDLADLLVEQGQDAGAGLIPTRLVAPPSRHWLGEPTPGISDGADVAVLEGGCGIWECCGVRASIDIGETVVRWNVHGLGTFTFDRTEYEQVIASVLDQTPRAPDWDEE